MAIINMPKNKKLFTEETYLFGRGKYVIHTGTNIKKALGVRTAGRGKVGHAFSSSHSK